MTAAERVEERLIGDTMVDVSQKGPNTLRDDLDQLLDDFAAMCVSCRTLTEIVVNRMEEEEREDHRRGA